MHQGIVIGRQRVWRCLYNISKGMELNFVIGKDQIYIHIQLLALQIT